MWHENWSDSRAQLRNTVSPSLRFRTEQEQFMDFYAREILPQIAREADEHRLRAA